MIVANSEQFALGEPASRELLLNSAREEIRANGILGLRVADVAARANYSVSVIYRHFGDRDGLLAAVLGDLYDEILERAATRIMGGFPADGPIALDDLVAVVPLPSDPELIQERRDRLQILAVAATNPGLEARISMSAQRARAAVGQFLESLRSRITDHPDFDIRVYTVMLVNQLLYYNSLLGDQAITDDEYRDFVRDKLLNR